MKLSGLDPGLLHAELVAHDRHEDGACHHDRQAEQECRQGRRIDREREEIGAHHEVELIETDVAATVSALADADITKVGDGVADAEVFSTFATLGVSATGYTASAEGSITSVRNLDSPKFIAPTNQYEKQFPLGREPVVQKNKFARIRVTFGTAVNAYAYMIVEV